MASFLVDYDKRFAQEKRDGRLICSVGEEINRDIEGSGQSRKRFDRALALSVAEQREKR